MAKKTFDIKSTLAVPTRSFSVEDIEAATRQIHQPEKRETAPVLAEVKKERTVKKVVSGEANNGSAKKEKAPKKVAGEVANNVQKTKQTAPPEPYYQRRRDPNAPVTRKVRLSVDVLPETHKRLKIRAIEQDSDIMRYVEMLIERDLRQK